LTHHEAPQSGRVKIPAAWIVGMAVFPFGLVVGFTVTALPFLLVRLGIPLYKVAAVSATVMSPTFWGFLLQPVMDVGLTRRAYSWLTTTVAAICLAAALLLLSPAHLGAATALLLVAELSMVLYSGAVTGWTAQFTPDSLRGSVSGWTNVANLGGGALGSLVVMSLVRHVALQWLGLGLGAVIVLGVLPTLLFPEPHSSSFRFKQIFTDALKTTWRACKTSECLTGFALFLVPASAGAAINLFSGMGMDFHTSEATVVWVTGAGCAITASVGALVGGYVANRVSRGTLYLSAGLVTSVCALVLAFSPHTPSAFILGALVYNGIVGVAYAAFNALGYQLVGQNSAVASTQLGLFSAATNLAIVYMTWADGQGYKHFGVRGLLLTDGLAGGISAILLLTLLGARLKRRRVDEMEVAAVAADG
jgi:MFS transporter, PAT family, beta-lactamase induction signal transducer AmpG